MRATYHTSSVADLRRKKKEGIGLVGRIRLRHSLASLEARGEAALEIAIVVEQTALY